MVARSRWRWLQETLGGLSRDGLQLDDRRDASKKARRTRSLRTGSEEKLRISPRPHSGKKPPLCSKSPEKANRSRKVKSDFVRQNPDSISGIRDSRSFISFLSQEKRMRVLARLLVISAYFVRCLSSGAQVVQPPQPWFTVSISTPKPVVKVGSEVRLRVVLTNNTDRDIRCGVGDQEGADPLLT
jgi:hypothetical protein